MSPVLSAVKQQPASIHHFLIVFALLCVCIPAPAGSAAVSLSAPDQNFQLPVNVTADRIVYSEQDSILTAAGQARITQGTRSITADTISINLVTHDTEAQGTVLLEQDGDRIACESFAINLHTQVGVVHEATIFIKNENLHIRGREVRKTGPDTYRVLNGIITTCDAKNPPWRIDAARIDVEIEGYAVARHPVFRIKSVPVLYLPAMLMPVKRERQSGLLFPELGYSSRMGMFMGNSLFWAINDQSDATVWLDTASRMGIGSGLEYRLLLSEDTSGKLYAYAAGETDSYMQDRYRTPYDRNNQRYYLNFEGHHYFDADTYLKADMSQVSDRQFYYDYRNIIRRSRGAIDRSSARNYDKEESTVFFNKNFDTSNLLVNMNWYRNLRFSDSSTVQRLPEVRYTTMLRPAGETPLFYQFEAGYDNFWRERGQRGQRLDIYPQLAMPMLMGGWLRFNPQVGMRGVYHFGLNRTQGDERGGIFPTVNAQLATSFVRIFDIDGQSLSKVRHMLEPGLEYEYVASADQSDFPDFDRPERYYKRHWVGYYLKNRFTALTRDSAGELSEHEVGYFKLGQAFNFTKPRQGLYYAGDRDRTSSDIFAELRVNVRRNLYLKGTSFYDTHDQRLRRYSMLAHLRGSGKNFISLEYRYWRDLYEILEVSTYYQIRPWLAVFLKTSYDYISNDDFDTDVGVEYHSQCWGWRLWFEVDGNRAGSARETSVKTMFFIKGLGDRPIL